MQLEYLPYTPTGPRHKYNIQPRELFIPNIQNQSSSKNNFGGNGGGSRDMLSRKKPILVSAAADGVIKVWDPQENHVLHSFYGHRNAITCFQFDQDKLVSGGEGTVKLWDLRNGLFVRDMIADITGAWKVAINERYAVCAVQRANSETWFEVMDFAVPGSDIL
jgi:WD40 repeat protein